MSPLGLQISLVGRDDIVAAAMTNRVKLRRFRLPNKLNYTPVR